jgi:hypothetical protein
MSIPGRLLSPTELIDQFLCEGEGDCTGELACGQPKILVQLRKCVPQIQAPARSSKKNLKTLWLSGMNTNVSASYPVRRRD